MLSNAKCPFCEKPIGLWTIMRAPMPSAIRCPHCREKIRVRGIEVYLLAYIVVAVLICAALVMARRHNLITGVQLIALAIILLLICEVTVSALVLQRARFTKPPPEA